MKKIIILAALVAANLWTYAQMTPEAIMGAVPTMPTSAQMLDYYHAHAFSPPAILPRRFVLISLSSASISNVISRANRK